MDKIAWFRCNEYYPEDEIRVTVIHKEDVEDEDSIWHVYTGVTYWNKMWCWEGKEMDFNYDCYWTTARIIPNDFG